MSFKPGDEVKVNNQLGTIIKPTAYPDIFLINIHDRGPIKASANHIQLVTPYPKTLFKNGTIALFRNGRRGVIFKNKMITDAFKECSINDWDVNLNDKDTTVYDIMELHFGNELVWIRPKELKFHIEFNEIIGTNEEKILKEYLTEFMKTYKLTGATIKIVESESDE